MVYVGGVGKGVLWANQTLEFMNRQRLFCPPPAVVLNPLNYADIALREYRSSKIAYDQSDLAKSPGDAIAFAVVNGLMKQLPCK